jgi:hypothetical protein
MAKEVGEVNIQNVTLSCGNPQNQKLNYNAQNGAFAGRCFYDKRGEYAITLEVGYINLLTNERLSYLQPVGTLNFKSDIQLYLAGTQNKQTTALSATQGEINLGKAPSKITVDTSAIFRDFALKEYKVRRDMDNDDINDRENLVRFDYIYKMPKVYYPTVTFPEISDFVYAFPVRVEQSDVPICDITLANFERSKYKIQTNFLDGSASSIASYSYLIIDASTNKTLNTIKQDTRDLDYTFPEKGSYLVGLDFITIDGKRGHCESDTLQLAKESVNIQYVIKQKLPDEREFKVVPQSAFSGSTVILSRIPQAIQIDLV